MRENIYNSSFSELKSFFIDLDEKAFRAEQLWNWLYVKGINELSGLNNISKNVINKKWPIKNLLEALKEYSKKRKHKRITFEYIMLEGINDSIKDAKELVKLIKPFKAKINLIPFNPWPGSNYKASSPDQIKVFKKLILEEGKLVATVRLPRGEDVLAACGQLKSF